MSPDEWDAVPGSRQQVRSAVAELEARGRTARRRRRDRSLLWLVAAAVVVALVLLIGWPR